MTKNIKIKYGLLIILGMIMILVTFYNGDMNESVLEDKDNSQALEVVYMGEVLGYINAEVSSAYIMEEAFSRLSVQLGQVAVMAIEFNEVSLPNKLYDSSEDILNKITDAYMTYQLSLKRDAVKLTIDDTELILASREEVKTVLESALEDMLNPVYDIDVNVEISGDHVSDINFESLESSEGSQLRQIDTIESLLISDEKVDQEDIITTDEAVNFITKLKDKPVSYEVVSGDVPSIIAEKNNIRLKTLYDLNPTLEDNERSLQIGQDIMITIPEAELSVEVIETIEYEEVITRQTTYVKDHNAYIGSDKIINQGRDGIKHVVATVTSVNGVESSRIIESEQIILEPIDKLVSLGSKALPSKGAIGSFISPLSDYHITSYFGSRWNDFHRGIDMGAVAGSSVRASDGGLVTYSGWNDSYGYYIEIDHGNNVKTRYAHNSKLVVSKGDYVSRYQEIAKVGSTGNSSGPHVHFEIIIEGTCVNPLDYIN